MQCQAINKQGRRCQNHDNTTHNGYCYIHQKKETQTTDNFEYQSRLLFYRAALAALIDRMEEDGHTDGDVAEAIWRALPDGPRVLARWPFTIDDVYGWLIGGYNDPDTDEE